MRGPRFVPRRPLIEAHRLFLHGPVLGLLESLSIQLRDTAEIQYNHRWTQMNTDKDWSKRRSFIAGKACDQPDASRLLGRSLGVVFVFASYFLRILLVFSWYSPPVRPGRLRHHPAGSAEPVPSYHSTGSVAIQTKPSLAPSCCPLPLPSTLLTWVFDIPYSDL
jgi:hypothetical protein